MIHATEKEMSENNYAPTEINTVPYRMENAAAYMTPMAIHHNGLFPGSHLALTTNLQDLNKEAASVEYLANDAKYIDQKKMYLQEDEAELLSKLVTQLKQTPPVFINHHSIRNILKSYFDSQYLKKLTETHRKMTVKGVFIATVIRYLILSQSDDWIADSKESFLEKYPEFENVESKWEFLALIRFDRALSIALNYLQGRGNKQLLLSVGAHLEGSNMQYVTGGQPSPGTKRRVQIFERLSGVRPVKRAKRGSLSGGLQNNSLLSDETSDRGSGEEEEGGRGSSGLGGIGIALGGGIAVGEGRKSSKTSSSSKRGRPPTRQLKYLPVKFPPTEAQVMVEEPPENEDNDSEDEGEEEEDSEDSMGNVLPAGMKVKTKKSNNNKMTISSSDNVKAKGKGKKAAGVPAFGALDLLSRIASEKFQQLDD